MEAQQQFRHDFGTPYRRAGPKRLVTEGITPDEVRRVDARLAFLGRGLGALRLLVGEGLLRLESAGGVQKLGFPTLESYAREALGRTGRWAADVRGLARRLTQLPILRAALAGGKLSSSMVELVARVATPDDEAEWVEAASQSTVRAMREKVKAARADATPDENDKIERVTIMTTVDRVDAWAFERARVMVESVGAGKGDAAIEAMLAEGLTEMLALRPDLDLPAGIGAQADEAARAWRDELVRMREEGEIACEPGVAPAPVEIEAREVIWPDDAVGIDRELRVVAGEIAWRDLELAHLGRRCFEGEMWRKLGYASFEQYCRERIGLSASSVNAKVALSRRLVGLPEIESAVATGIIGYEAAALVARAAGPRTVDDWVARAAERTVKQLRQEIECVEMTARVEGRAVAELGPPDESAMADAAALERGVIALVTGQTEPSPDVRDSVGEPEVELTTTTMRLRVSEDTGRFWRALERAYAGLWRPGSFVAFLVRAVMKAWTGAVPKQVAYGDVYLRDRWRCASPICERRDVTPHHILFKSQGGGEERGNLLSLCVACHLSLVHGGLLTVKGDAEEGLIWEAAGWAKITP